MYGPVEGKIERSEAVEHAGYPQGDKPAFPYLNEAYSTEHITEFNDIKVFSTQYNFFNASLV